MFGLGKKKNGINAEGYAINLVTLTFSMKNSFIQVWNSYRHIADVEPISTGDKEIFKFFAFYSSLNCGLKQYNKIEEDELRNVFSTFCTYKYVDSLESCGFNLPQGFSLESHKKMIIDLTNQFTRYSKDHPKESIFEELMSFFLFEMKGLIRSEQNTEFCKKTYPFFESLHREGWDVIKQSRSYPILDDSFIYAIEKMLTKLPE